MKYLRVRWQHDFDDEPVLLYSEIDDDRFEVRKVDEYRDGRRDVAHAGGQTGSTDLGEVPTPAIEEINAQGEFVAEAITGDEFERVWAEAWQWFDDA